MSTPMLTCFLLWFARPHAGSAAAFENWLLGRCADEKWFCQDEKKMQAMSIVRKEKKNTIGRPQSCARILEDK